MKKRLVLALSGLLVLVGLVLLFGTTPRFVQKDASSRLGSEKFCASQAKAERLVQIMESSDFHQMIAESANTDLARDWFRGDDLLIESKIEEVGAGYPTGILGSATKA